MLQKAEGGLPQVFDALRASDDDDAVKFITRYDRLSESDRRKLSIEEICIAEGIRVVDFLGTATKALFEASRTVAAIVSASSHELVVKKSVQMALRDGGTRDREHIHTAVGFLPSPKGTVILNQRLSAVANFNEGGGVDPDNPGPTMPDIDELTSMDSDTVGLHALSRKLLEDGRKTAEAQEACTPNPK